MTPFTLIERIRRCGGDLQLLPDGESFAIERRSRVPDDLAAEARAQAAAIMDFLKSQGDVPLSTASATSATSAIFATPAEANPCVNFSTFAKSAEFLAVEDARAMRVGAATPHPGADDLLRYAVEKIQAVADRHPEAAARMQARFDSYERQLAETSP